MTADAAVSPVQTQVPPPPPVSRTCECLTQTLWCHGCGTAVGYMIVTPCIRCTSSTTPNNRCTNGHRFVFYSAEIAASERHYVPGECGIVAEAHTPPPPMPMPTTMHRPRYASVNPGTPRHRHTRSNGSITSPIRRNSVPSIPSGTPPTPASPTYSDLMSSPPPLEPVSPPYPQRPQRVPELEQLHGGEVVFWHHLVRSGEIPAVVDDPRARAPAVKEQASASALAGKVSALLG